MAAPHQNEGPHLAPSRHGSTECGWKRGERRPRRTGHGSRAEPDGDTRIPNGCRGGRLADGGFERREAKVKIFLRRKNNEDQGGLGSRWSSTRRQEKPAKTGISSLTRAGLLMEGAEERRKIGRVKNRCRYWRLVLRERRPQSRNSFLSFSPLLRAAALKSTTCCYARAAW
jgi:hypothetical protein